MTNNILYMAFAFIVGMLLGTIFFGGLWLTIKNTATSKVPGLLFFGSFVLRIAIALFGFYYVSHGNWQRLLTCLVGFIVARFLVIHVTKSKEKQKEKNEKEESDEAKS